MPDMTIVTPRMCAQLDRPCRTVQSKSDPRKEYFVCLGTERRPPTCTCPAFAFNANVAHCTCGKTREKHVLPHEFAASLEPFHCKHINDLIASVCQWDEQYSEEKREDETCPRCGGPTMSVRAGV